MHLLIGKDVVMHRLHMALNFYWSLILGILQVFSCLQNYLNKNFGYVNQFLSLTARASMDNISCPICNELSSKRYLQSRHCFADSCELERMRVWQCVLACNSALCVQPIREINSTKSSKTSNVDPRKWHYTVIMVWNMIMDFMASCQLYRYPPQMFISFTHQKWFSLCYRMAHSLFVTAPKSRGSTPFLYCLVVGSDIWGNELIVY